VAVVLAGLMPIMFGSGTGSEIMQRIAAPLVGGFWLLWTLGHHLSIASAVGFIALAGVAAEFGVVMLLYLRHAWEDRVARGEPGDEDTLVAAIREGAVMRVRPKAMTVAVVLAGLMPIMFGSGTGSEIMQRIAAPLLSMLVVPAAWLLMRRRGLARRVKEPSPRGNAVPEPSHRAL